MGALRELGVKTLGLETMPRSYRNLQFYTGMGMEVSGMTWDLSRYYGNDAGGPAPILGPAPDIALRSVSASKGAERDRLMETVARLSRVVSGALDYTHEVRSTLEHGLGDAVVGYRGDEALGFAVVHTEPYAREEEPGTARVNVVVVRPLEEGRPMGRGFIRSLEEEMIARGMEGFTFRVPARETGIARWLTGAGYRITHSDVRMCCSDLPEERRPGVLHMNKWE